MISCNPAYFCATIPAPQYILQLQHVVFIGDDQDWFLCKKKALQNDEEEKTILFGCVIKLKPSFHTTSVRIIPSHFRLVKLLKAFASGCCVKESSGSQWASLERRIDYSNRRRPFHFCWKVGPDYFLFAQNQSHNPHRSTKCGKN